MVSDEILAKLEKLLALEKNAGSEHEAANAAAKAAAMMAKYHIDRSQLTGAAKAKEEPVEFKPLEDGAAATHEQWKRNLAFSLGRGFYSRVILVDDCLWIVGRLTDRQTVSYLHRFLVAEIERMGPLRWAAREVPDVDSFYDLGAKGEESPADRTDWIRGFQRGAVEVIDERLGERATKLPPGVSEAQALVLRQRETDVAEWIKRNLSLRSVHGRRESYSAQGYRAGRQAGHAMHIGADGSRAKQLSK